jgi:hypothetical protein
VGTDAFLEFQGQLMGKEVGKDTQRGDKKILSRHFQPFLTVGRMALCQSENTGGNCQRWNKNGVAGLEFISRFLSVKPLCLYLFGISRFTLPSSALVAMFVLLFRCHPLSFRNPFSARDLEGLLLASNELVIYSKQ